MSQELTRHVGGELNPDNHGRHGTASALVTFRPHDWRSMSPTLPEPASADLAHGPTRYVMRKLPHVTLLFWIVKIIAVTLGRPPATWWG